jgi:hypothetical protein
MKTPFWLNRFTSKPMQTLSLLIPQKKVKGLHLFASITKVYFEQRRKGGTYLSASSEVSVVVVQKVLN